MVASPYLRRNSVSPTFVDAVNSIRKDLKFRKKPRNEMTRHDALLRWPMIAAHVICESLGYATPDCAAMIILDAANGKENWCEWIYSCHDKDPKRAVRLAIAGRRGHHGYMAEIRMAELNVAAELRGKFPHDALASWF